MGRGLDSLSLVVFESRTGMTANQAGNRPPLGLQCHIRLPLHIDRNDRRTFLRSLFSSLSRPRDRSRADASVHTNERHALSRWDHQRLQTSPLFLQASQLEL